MEDRYQYLTEAAKEKHRYTSTNIDTNIAGIPETQRGKNIGCGPAVKRKVTKRAQQEVLIHDCSFPGVRKCTSLLPFATKFQDRQKQKDKQAETFKVNAGKRKEKKRAENDQILKDNDKVKL